MTARTGWDDQGSARNTVESPITSFAGPEHAQLLVRRSVWSLEQYERRLADTLVREPLAP